MIKKKGLYQLFNNQTVNFEGHLKAKLGWLMVEVVSKSQRLQVYLLQKK